MTATTHNPVNRGELMALAVPAALAALLQHAFRPLDQFYVGWLGREPQAALGATTFVIILSYAGYMLISAGVGPLVARATGAQRPEERARVIGAGISACFLLYFLLMAVVLLFSQWIVIALGLEGDAAIHAEQYLRVLFVTGLALPFSPLIDASLIAMGNTRTPLLIQTGVLVVNAIGTPALMFYWDFGVAGAALGTTVAQLAGVVGGLFLLCRSAGVGVVHLGLGPLVRKVMKIGLPIGIATAMYSLVYWVLLGTSISRLGSHVNAALGIGFSGLEATTWPVFMGVSVAVSSIVGRRLGQGQPEEAWRVLKLTLGPQVALGTVAGCIFYFLGPLIVAPFSADEQVYEQAVIYAVVLAWSQPFVALEALFEGVLAGAGDTKRVLLGTVPYNVLRIPLAWIFAFPLSMGAAGIWWAINVTTIMKALAKGWMVYRGAWARLTL